MIINNGIISNGDNNQNIINEIDYDELKEELNVLKKYVDDNIDSMINVCNKNDFGKFIQKLRALSAEAKSFIKSLGLSVLESVIEKYIIK